MTNRSARARRAVLISLLLVVGCTPPIRQWDLRNRPLTCDDANRFAFKTLESMGFAVTSFEPATVGAPGTLRGKRSSDARTQAVTVAITCGSAGATLDIREDNQLVDQIDLKRAFFMSFTNVESITAAAEEMEKKVAAGTAPESIQRHDLQVDIEPVPGQGAKLHFGLDLAAAGLLPVRVRVANHTGRAYSIDPRGLRLSRADGQRAEAMTVENATDRIVAARDPAGKPLTALSKAAVAEKLSAELFSTRTLPPGAQATGFLYFPLARYRGARIVLTDEASGESEGVAVDFSRP